MKYLFFSLMIITLITIPLIENSFATSYDLVSQDGRVYSVSQVSSECPTTVSFKDLVPLAQKTDSTLNNNCIVAWFEWDITTLPMDSVYSASINFTGTSSSGVSIQCSVRDSTVQPTIGAQNTIYSNGLNGTKLGDDVDCTLGAVTSNYIFNFNGTGLSELQSHIDASTAWYGAIQFFPNATRPTGVSEVLTYSADSAVLTVTYTDVPEAVDDLSTPSQSFGSVDLTWTEPELFGWPLVAYQINYTTPYGDPTTFLSNNTSTSVTVSSLSISTPYSFRVAPWTVGGTNASGLILNVTTAGNFTIGTAIFNQTNTQVLPITYEEQAINSTAKFLNVTFANTYTMECNFHYKFANTNQTYSNLTSYAVSSTLDETSFVFVNATNEIIDVLCYDTVSGEDAKYLLVQLDFPLLQQIASFRAGEYGTQGDFGIFDFVTLLVVIMSMIGLNRVNESVGIVFNIIFLGSLAYFDIIELPTIIFGLIAVVMVFVITSTRKP